MSADIIDIRTRKAWSAEHIERVQRSNVVPRADCTAPFYDLIFLDPDDEGYVSDLRRSPHTQ